MLYPAADFIGGLGFFIVIVLAATISDVETVLGSSFGQPMAQIYYDALGKRATLGFMSILFSKWYLQIFDTLKRLTPDSCPVLHGLEHRCGSIPSDVGILS